VKGPGAVRSSLCSRNYKTGGICRQEGRPTNTGCQNTTQHNTTPTQQCLRTEVQKETKKNAGQQSGENKRKMSREEDAWTIAT